MANWQELKFNGQTSQTLNAPGLSGVASVADFKLYSLSLTITGIGTNIVVFVEESQDGTNWNNAASDGSKTTITANGTYKIRQDKNTARQVRLNWESASGGTPQILLTGAKID